MIRFLIILLTGIAGSLFLFPFNLPISITVNTKMILAAIGAGVFFIEKAQKKAPSISRDFLVLCLITIGISLWAFTVTVLNHTTDYAFARYIVSVVVWLGAAYAFTWMIRQAHGRLDIELICQYLTAICVFQCILAYAMTLLPWLKSLIDSLMGETDSFMGVIEGRLYGLGAALDPAGLRFSGILVLLAYLIYQNDFSEHIVYGILYILSFLIISVFGNMISRTTTVGMLVAIAYFVYLSLFTSKKGGFQSFWVVTAPLLLLGVVASVWFYESSPDFRNDLRFGFEGFFSIVEKGHWETYSTNVLESLIVWPESLHTWILGDGYFGSPLDRPDRFGQVYGGYYMHTDIGYLRYIFYFGVIGLLGMMLTFTQMMVTCIRRLKADSLLFVCLLLITFIGWLKVSSDIIMVFAPFLILAYLETDTQ